MIATTACETTNAACGKNCQRATTCDVSRKAGGVKGEGSEQGALRTGRKNMEAACPHPSFRDPFVWHLDGEALHMATCVSCRSTLSVAVTRLCSACTAPLTGERCECGQACKCGRPIIDAEHPHCLSCGAALSFGWVMQRYAWDCVPKRLEPEVHDEKCRCWDCEDARDVDEAMLRAKEGV